MTVPEVRALLGHLLEVRKWDTAEILRWSAWRRERNRRAADCHRRRRERQRRRDRRHARKKNKDPAL